MEFALFENTADENGISLLFTKPIHEICIYEYNQIPIGMQQIEQLSKDGYYLMGYVSYNANINNKNNENPLLHYIAYKKLDKFLHSELQIYLDKYNITYSINNFSSIEFIEAENNYNEYQEMFNEVQQNLQLGNSYQINLTQRYKLDINDTNLFTLYHKLSRTNKVRYASYLPFKPIAVVSISPELFFEKSENIITVNPMKGTMPRSSDIELDKLNKEFLQNDEKNRTENLIIVDLLRNDLSKIAETSTIKATKLFEVEEYPTVFQMTSKITAKVNDNISLRKIIENIFPAGSITGAPKKKTMELIDKIETSPRGIYTGSIGYLLPNNYMLFNVAIRTISKHHSNRFSETGAGGGITINTDSQTEWEEMNTKLRFLTQLYSPNFQLIESMLVDNNEIINLAQHLQRLKNSADKLLFKCDIRQIKEQINTYISKIKQPKSKLRIELYANGNVLIDCSQINPIIKKYTIMLLNKSIDTSHPLFKHKTNSKIVRGLYTDLDNLYKPNNIDEIIFCNQNNEITESRFYNLIIEIDEQLITPPASCGLLNGVFRQSLINQNLLTEKIITKDMLNSADKIYLCNDVRGLIECEYCGEINDTYN